MTPLAPHATHATHATTHHLARPVRSLRRGLAAALVLAVAFFQPILVAAQGVPAAGSEDGTAAGPVLGFDEAMAAAREGPSVQQASLALQQAQARLQASFGNLSASLKAGYSVTTGELNGASVDDAGFDPISLSATFDVVPYGPAWDGYKSAQRSVASAQLAVRSARYQATSDTASAYLTALRAQQQVAIDRTAVQLAAAQQAHVESQAANGDATAASVLATQLATNQARATQQDDQLDLEAALDQLGQLVGQVVGGVDGEPAARAEATTAGADADATPADGSTADADAAALARRADVRRARSDVEDAEASKASSLRSVLPTASLSADVRGGDGATSWSGGLSYDTSSFQPSLNASVTPAGSGGAATDGTALSVSLGLSVPLDTATPAHLRAADIALRSAQAQLRQTQDAARLAIQSARRALASRQRSAELAEQQRQQRALLLEQAHQRLDLGLVPEVDVDQARLDLARAELAEDQARDAVLLARMNLQLALGLDPMEVF